MKTSRKIIILNFIFFGSINLVAEDIPDWRHDWRNSSMQFIAELNGDSPPEDFRRAGRLAALAAEPADERLLSVEVSRAAKEKLLSLPKSIDILASEIESSKKKWKRTDISTEYDRTRANIIRALSVLPSPETVRVLGPLLGDLEETLDEPASGGRVANAIYAQRALIGLLENPPTTEKYLGQQVANVPTWELWFEQVKAGTRTFRFKGDPQPYTLIGPADEALDTSLDRTTRTRDAPPAGSRDGSSEGGENDDESPSRLPLFLLAAFLPAAGVAWLVLRRKGASAA